jgi:hypothetical protein
LGIVLAVLLALTTGVILFAGSSTPAFANTPVLVCNLDPSWTAPGGGGVFSAYVGPPAYNYVSPGTTAVYDGREAGIIKAGITPDPDDGNYWDEGLFGFRPDVTIDAFAAGTLTYDVQNQFGVNPVWMTIEIDTGTLAYRPDNTAYQFVPTPNPAGWNTFNAGAGMWLQWTTYTSGVTVGSPMTLSAVAAANTGLNVVRTYLRLGMGNSYNNGGTTTVAWVDKTTLGGVTYDFVVSCATPTPTPPPGVGGTIELIELDGVASTPSAQQSDSAVAPYAALALAAAAAAIAIAASAWYARRRWIR